jgi:hypothetical protein
MKTPLVSLLALIALGLCTGIAADQDNSNPSTAKLAVRMRFVPGGPPEKGAADFKGGSWTALVSGPEKGVLWLQAHAGVGDKFPVIDNRGVRLFEVALIDGDDKHVVLEIRSQEGAKKVALRRDKPGAVKVAGIKYDLLFPSITIGAAPGEKPTTNKAMLFVFARNN